MDTEYPKWMYGPDDAARIFEKGDVIPKGWADHPEKVQAPKKSGSNHADDAATEAERVAAIAELREAGVEISDDATVEEINAAIDTLTSQRS